MGLIVAVLNLAAAGSFLHGGSHGSGHIVRIHDDLALGISGRTANGLDQAGLAAQETFLVRIQNGHQAHFRQIQTLTKQVDTHQHIEFAHTQIPDDLHALHGADIRVHIANLDACFLQVHRQILRHFLGQGGNKHPFLLGRSRIDLADEIVDLAVDRLDFHNWIQQARGTDHLFHDLAGAGTLIFRRSGGNIDHLIDLAVKLPEIQRPVVIGRGQPEAVVHQGILAAAVACVHGPGLGQGHMALVHDEEKILREIVQQSGRGCARGTALDHPGIILDAAAEADFRQHFNIVGSPLGNALGFNEFVLRLEEGHLRIAFFLDLPHGPLEFFPGSHIVAGRIDGHVIQIPLSHTGNGVDLADAVDLISEELHPDGFTCPVGRINFQGIPPEPELVSGEVHIVSLIADLRQFFQHRIQRILLTHPEGDHHAPVVDGVAQTIQAADRADHDHIPPLKEGGGGAVAEPVDFLVHRGILLNIGVRVGNVCLRLIVIVVGNEVFHRIVGEKLPEFAAKLSRQGLIVSQHQGGTVHLFDDGGHGEGLAGAGDTQQGLFS